MEKMNCRRVGTCERRLKRLNKKHKEILEKLNYLRQKFKNYSDLVDRNCCPQCEQVINPTFFKQKADKLKEKVDFLCAWIDYNRNYNKLCSIRKPIVENNKELEAMEKERINGYLENKRNRINKTIRDYNNGVDEYLPNNIITIEEKKLWNAAMNLQLDNRNMEENEELLFEV